MTGVSALPTGILLRVLPAVASLGAGVVHAAVVPGHLDSWVASGVFFVLLAAFQVLWAAAWLWRPGRPLLAVGLVAGLATVGLWAWSRSPFGLPIGPDAGEQMQMGAAGVISTVLELVVVAALLAWAWSPRPDGAERRTVASPGGAVAATALALATAGVAGLSVLGVQAAWAHDHAAHGGGHAGEHGDHQHQEQNEKTPDDRDRQPSPSPSPSTGTPGQDGDGHDHAH